MLLCILFIVTLMPAMGKADEDMKILYRCVLEKGLILDEFYDMFDKLNKGDERAANILGCVQKCVLEEKGIIKNERFNMVSINELVKQKLRLGNVDRDELMKNTYDCVETMKMIPDKCIAALVFTKCIMFLQ